MCGDMEVYEIIVHEADSIIKKGSTCRMTFCPWEGCNVWVYMYLVIGDEAKRVKGKNLGSREWVETVPKRFRKWHWGFHKANKTLQQGFV